MKRLFFPVIIAALSICQSASAQYPGQNYVARMPNALVSTSEKAVTTNNQAMNSTLGGGYYGGVDAGYGFGANNCGCNTGCCDGVWGGYAPTCGHHLFGKHLHHGKCCGTSCGCGGCAGGCFGSSFAGGCGGCGGCGCGHHGLGLHHKLHSCCAGFLHHCKGLFHHGCGMSCGCGDAFYGAPSGGCGCGNGHMMNHGGMQGTPTMSAPPVPPAETVPSTEPSPAAAPASAKSAQRIGYPRAFGVFPSSW